MVLTTQLSQLTIKFNFDLILALFVICSHNRVLVTAKPKNFML